MGKINVELPEDVHKAVKIRAIEAGKDMKVWIVDVLREAGEKKKNE